MIWARVRVRVRVRVSSGELRSSISPLNYISSKVSQNVCLDETSPNQQSKYSYIFLVGRGSSSKFAKVTYSRIARPLLRGFPSYLLQ